MYISPLDDAAPAEYPSDRRSLRQIFGVVSVCIAEELPKDTDTILAFVGDYVKRVKGAAKTFKVTRQAFGQALSADFARACGTVRRENFGSQSRFDRRC